MKGIKEGYYLYHYNDTTKGKVAIYAISQFDSMGNQRIRPLDTKGSPEYVRSTDLLIDYVKSGKLQPITFEEYQAFQYGIL